MIVMGGPQRADPLVQNRLAFHFTICGVAELDEHCTRGVTHIISILDPEWPTPTAFDNFGIHRRLDLRFHDIIDVMEGARVPGADEVGQILSFGRDMLTAERVQPHLLIHCQMGVSRSTAAAALLLAQAHPEFSGVDIVDHVVRQRPQAWPNLRIVEIGDNKLGRNGELVTAVRAHYRRRVAERPELVDIMTRIGREAEIEGLR
jgi:predicted protein tyrosine phosphatase